MTPTAKRQLTCSYAVFLMRPSGRRAEAMSLLSLSRSFDGIKKAVEHPTRGGHRMKSYRTPAVLVAGLCLTVLMAACAGSSAGSGNTGGNGGSPTTQPTATVTVKAKPTAVPHFTAEYCQQLMSLNEMNTLL